MSQNQKVPVSPSPMKDCIIRLKIGANSPLKDLEFVDKHGDIHRLVEMVSDLKFVDLLFEVPEFADTSTLEQEVEKHLGEFAGIAISEIYRLHTTRLLKQAVAW